MKNKMISLMVLLNVFAWQVAAQAVDGQALLGQHLGKSFTGASSCEVLATENWGFLDIRIVSGNNDFRLRNISMRKIKKAIAEGYKRQFIAYAPRMPLSSEEWYVSGMLKEDGSLQFISIVHNWSDSWPFGAHQESATCQVE